jgi:hypothetical protein
MQGSHEAISASCFYEAVCFEPLLRERTALTVNARHGCSRIQQPVS